MFRKAVLITTVVMLFGLVITVAAERHVASKGGKYIVSPPDYPKMQAAIVLGAYVHPGGSLSHMLADRVKTAVELYEEGYVDKILMTGDNGRIDYDEVNYMRLYAENLGVPTEDIFMDHAGFSTYDSMYRAREIFQVHSAVVVTQAFHLPRATYTARAMGIDAVGVGADKHVYAGASFYELREVAARIKAFLQIHVIKSKPRFLGEVLPIEGDGRVTHDDFARVNARDK